ncbi:hypothetical protein Tco_1348014 [Tanacetum coccineum]
MKSQSTTDSDINMMSDSNTTDTEEKKDTVPELKSAEAVAKEKGKGKKPIKVGKKTQTEVDKLTRKAKGLTLEVPRNVRPPIVVKRKEKKSDAEVVLGRCKAKLEEVCTNFNLKGRKRDDDPAKDGAGSAAGPLELVQVKKLGWTTRLE